MPLSFSIHKAGRIIRNGGVVTCPTEGVFGLSCLPDDMQAVETILRIKQRNPSLGLILIAANLSQLKHWIDTEREIPDTETDPVTWVVPASAAVPPWISGRHKSVAVRICSHPIAAALCTAAGSALVSTSANISGRQPVKNTYVLRRQFRDLVDYIVPGQCGLASGPSEIRDLMNNSTLRPAGS